MKRFRCGSGRAGHAVSFAAVLCLAATAAQAQIYSTTFDSTDTVNGAPATGFTPYSNASTLVDNLDGQNNWGSTDPAPATAQSGNSAQINGGSDYVGPFGSFFGGTFAGAIGGNQRANPGTNATPDVVPSTGSLGVISLYHPLSTVPVTAPRLTLNVDFTLTSPTTFTSRDSFAFSLRNAAGTASLISINFTPNANFTDPNTGQTVQSDNVTTTVGTATNVSTNVALVLSGTYHLRLVVTPGATGTYTGDLTNTANNVTNTFNGSLSTASITLANVGRFSVDWNLANTTTNANGGLTGAGDHSLAFDNLAITVPEPSTYALLALGLLGFAGARRWHGQQA